MGFRGYFIIGIILYIAFNWSDTGGFYISQEDIVYEFKNILEYAKNFLDEILK